MVLTGKDEKEVLDRITEFRKEFKARPLKKDSKRANNMTKYTSRRKSRNKYLDT